MPTRVRAARYGNTCAARSSAGSDTARTTGADAIPNRLSIEQQPAVVNARSRIGDKLKPSSARTITSHRQLVERKFGFTLMRKVERGTADAVSKPMTKLLKPYRHRVHTITSDNGKEFAGHEDLASALQADYYFARPYASWEHGTDESTNGLIRQYFSKGMDFTNLHNRRSA